MVERVAITAVRPNLISKIDRIRLTRDPTSWIYTKGLKERGQGKRGSKESTQKQT